MSAQAQMKHQCLECGKGFLGGPTAKRCRRCRADRHTERMRLFWATRKKYIWTPERDQILREKYDGRIKGRADEVARQLGWPSLAIKRHASELGLSHPSTRQDWTPQEEAFLMEHAGSRHVYWMAKKLKRGLTSIVLKLKRMKISRRWREGYTLRELELCFGIDHHGIDKWIREGKLIGRRRGTKRQGPGGAGGAPADPWVFTDADILRFIEAYPLAFRLDKVDQFWFMDLLTGGGLIRRALKVESAA